MLVQKPFNNRKVILVVQINFGFGILYFTFESDFCDKRMPETIIFYQDSLA